VAKISSPFAATKKTTLQSAAAPIAYVILNTYNGNSCSGTVYAQSAFALNTCMPGDVGSGYSMYTLSGNTINVQTFSDPACTQAASPFSTPFAAASAASCSTTTVSASFSFSQEYGIQVGPSTSFSSDGELLVYYDSYADGKAQVTSGILGWSYVAAGSNGCLVAAPTASNSVSYICTGSTITVTYYNGATCSGSPVSGGISTGQVGCGNSLTVYTVGAFTNQGYQYSSCYSVPRSPHGPPGPAGPSSQAQWATLSAYKTPGDSTCSGVVGSYTAILFNHCYVDNQLGRNSVKYTLVAGYGIQTVYQTTDCSDAGVANLGAVIGCNVNNDGTSTTVSVGPSPLMPSTPGFLQSGYDDILTCVNDVVNPNPQSATIYAMTPFFAGTNCYYDGHVNPDSTQSHQITAIGNALQVVGYSSQDCSGSPVVSSVIPNDGNCDDFDSIGLLQGYERIGVYVPPPSKVKVAVPKAGPKSLRA